MARSRRVEFMDTVNDSDDSDYEFFLHGDPNEEIKDQLRFVRLYRSLNEQLMGLRSGRSYQSSKAVQTDPDISRLPSSWLLLGEKLVDDLYICLRNMINTLYHSPNGYCKDGAEKAKLDPESMKYFSYNNGYWHSKLLPQVKIPATVGVDTNIHLESFKEELHGLLEKVRKLKDCIPYMMELEIGEASAATETQGKTYEDKCTHMEEADVMRMYKMANLPRSECCCENEDWSDSCSNFSDKSSGSVKSGKSLPDRFGKFREYGVKRSIDSIPDRKNTKTLSQNSVPGVVISKYKCPQQTSNYYIPIFVDKRAPSRNSTHAPSNGNAEHVLRTGGNSGHIKIVGQAGSTTKPSASTIARETKGILADCSKKLQDIQNKMGNGWDKGVDLRNEGNSSKEVKIHSASDSKNFIKRNILATKYPPNRASTSKSMREPAKLVVHQCFLHKRKQV